MSVKIVVYLAFLIKNSKRYQRLKKKVYDWLENPESQRKKMVDIFMVCVVMSSVFLLIYEADGNDTLLTSIFERLVLTLFIIEYVLRAWLYSDSHKIVLKIYERSLYLNIPVSFWHITKAVIKEKIKYVFTPLAIIDLLAIFPSYREARFLRFFLFFRLLKLFRYLHSIKMFADVLASKRFELYTLAIFLGFLVFIGSTGVYLFESPVNGGQVHTFFDAFYWSIVTVATVGYGDISPHTVGGRLVAIALILSGLGVLAFFTSIMVSGFSEKMHDLQENKVFSVLKRQEDFIIICGFGRVGQHIAKQLERDKINFVIIDMNPVTALQAKQLGYLTIHADASKNGVMKNAGINNGASAILCTTGDDVINVYITLTSRHLNPTIRIISRANDENNVKKIYQAGASHVIRPFEIAGMVVAEYVGQPVAFEAILGILREESDISMETLTVYSSAFIEGMSIAEVGFKQRKLLLLGVVSANALHEKHKNSYKINDKHFYFNPEPNFILQTGDLLIVLGRELGIEHFREQIETSRLKMRRRA